MIENFGKNVRFDPARVAAPSSEAELLETLDGHGGRLRALGAGHSWSPLIETDELLVDLRRMSQVKVWEDAEGNAWAEAQAGCRVKHLLAELQRHQLTLPSVGLISEQSIGGATATGTHGSGRHSLSHYLQEVRLANYDDRGQPRIVTAVDGELLQAARCSLGALGIVSSVRFRCVPQYQVEERLQWRSLEEILQAEDEWPLQQFFLMPDGRRWLAQQRRVSQPSRGCWHAPLYRGYWFASMDVGLHTMLKLLIGLLGSQRLASALMKHIAPWTVITGWQVRDRSDRMLVMEHELFRHLETELFVPADHVQAAGRLLASTFAHLDHGAALTCEASELLGEAGTRQALEQLRGVYRHHYPVCFRKILPDDTLISMAAGDQVWHSISLITYQRRRDTFYRFAAWAAQTMSALFGARLHWGKHLSLPPEELTSAYPRWQAFVDHCRQLDPQGRFRNRLIDSLLPEA